MIKLGNILKKGRKKYYIVTSSGIDIEILLLTFPPPATISLRIGVGTIETDIPNRSTPPIFPHWSSFDKFR
jgi:hypothetical protein